MQVAINELAVDQASVRKMLNRIDRKLKGREEAECSTDSPVHLPLESDGDVQDIEEKAKDIIFFQQMVSYLHRFAYSVHNKRTVVIFMRATMKF